MMCMHDVRPPVCMRVYTLCLCQCLDVHSTTQTDRRGLDDGDHRPRANLKSAMLDGWPNGSSRPNVIYSTPCVPVNMRY